MELNYDNIVTLGLSGFLFFAGWIIGLEVKARKDKRKDGI